MLMIGAALYSRQCRAIRRGVLTMWDMISDTWCAIAFWIGLFAGWRWNRPSNTT
jgi:hypothetical protein